MKNKVEIGFTDECFDKIKAAAELYGMTVSAFVESASLLKAGEFIAIKKRLVEMEGL